MIRVPSFSKGDNLSQELIDTLCRAIRELQGLAIATVHPPLQRSGNTLLSIPSAVPGPLTLLKVHEDFPNDSYYVNASRMHYDASGNPIMPPSDHRDYHGWTLFIRNGYTTTPLTGITLTSGLSYYGFQFSENGEDRYAELKWIVALPTIPDPDKDYMLVYDADSQQTKWIETGTTCP